MSMAAAFARRRFSFYRNQNWPIKRLQARKELTMHVNLYEADDFSEEILVKAEVNLLLADLVALKNGEMMVSSWMESRDTGAEYRIIVQGRRVGVNQDKIIDVRDRPLILTPEDFRRGAR